MENGNENCILGRFDKEPWQVKPPQKTINQKLLIIMSIWRPECIFCLDEGKMYLPLWLSLSDDFKWQCDQVIAHRRTPTTVFSTSLKIPLLITL